jgi:hypothetical protein
MSFTWSKEDTDIATWVIQHRCKDNGGVLDVCSQDLTPAICDKLRLLQYMVVLLRPQRTRIVEPATAQDIVAPGMAHD